MFGGGKASLELEDEKEPLSCGIEIKVQPPGKQLKTITLLSGGEKAFVAIALYFAILKVRPTPFCMLDEIDAALDDRNVERFAAYLHKFSGKTQFIVITHRRGTMEAADVLYGVTMQEQGISKFCIWTWMNCRSSLELQHRHKRRAYMGFFEKLKQGLSKTASSISSVFTASELDDEFYDDLEERLILADLGMQTTEEAMEKLRALVRERHIKTVEEAKLALREVLEGMMDVGATTLDLSTKPSVILVIGVNGVGKTTTIGKLSNLLRESGRKVLLCAGDTFRAAAADQLEIWSNRAHVDIIRQHEGADPASVLFDAIAAAKARGSDVIICDTAGRLHNKQNLMNELGKISRIIDRELPNASKEVLLVLDGTTGQNGLIQAEQFSQIAGRDGHGRDEARWHGKGRCGHRGLQYAQNPGQICRRGRADGRSDGSLTRTASWKP